MYRLKGKQSLIETPLLNKEPINSLMAEISFLVCLSLKKCPDDGLFGPPLLCWIFLHPKL